MSDFFALDIKQKTRKTESCQGKNLFCFKYEVSTLVTRLLSLLEYLFPVFVRESNFVPGCPGIEEFVSGSLLLPLSRDKGTVGQGIIFVPRKRQNGTSRPGLSQDIYKIKIGCMQKTCPTRNFK